MDFIPLSQVLKEMQNGQPFDIGFCTADKAKGTGGEIIHVSQAIIKEKHIHVPETTPASPSSVLRDFAKPPSHHKNATRNIYIPASNQTRKLHIYLITSFNGKKVIWS